MATFLPSIQVFLYLCQGRGSVYKKSGGVEPDYFYNPLPHGVLATFFLTAGGFMSLPIKDDISRETTILMRSLRTHRTSAVSSQGLYYNYPPLPPLAIERSLYTLPGTIVYITA
jgi:hypothetical protein